jgi:hypothetical protein
VDAPDVPMDFRSAFANLPAGPARSIPAPEPVEDLAPLAPAPFALPGRPAASEPPPVPAVAWPLFAVNWLLEAVLGLLGPVGAVVRHPAMKHPLGWLGILLLLAAGAWAARGMGWVAFPLPLPQ